MDKKRAVNSKKLVSQKKGLCVICKKAGKARFLCDKHWRGTEVHG